MKRLTRLMSATALAAALATAACNRNPDATDGNAQGQMALPALPATLPLETGAATDIALAPSASDLPDAKPVRLARVADASQAYGYADAAWTYDEALGDAPPDYGFDYDGADPWAWQGYDDSLMVAEPIDDGYRYYYFRAGANEPYFVRDSFYSYGFADGLLAVVYGADGGIVPYADYGPRLIYASRYYARGRQLWGASRQTGRRPVIAANWLRQSPVIFASRERWGSGRARQPDWRRYADAEHPRQTAYWRTEQVRRQADARRFDGWRAQGFRAAPPPRAIPPAWEQAKWAQDTRRYRPAAEPRRDDRPQADQRDARRDRQEGQQQARRDQRQAERPAPAAAGRDQADREQRREQAQADRRGADQAGQREARQAERQPAQQARERDAQQADTGRRQARQREAQQAERQQQQTARQADQREARQARPGQRPDTRQTERGPAQQAAQTQRQEAQQVQRREAQQAERRQAAPTEQRQAQQAERAQRQHADRADARQAQQAERQQAAQAQRQPAQEAARQQRQTEPRQQPHADRQQAQQQRQQQRQERRDARGPGPN